MSQVRQICDWGFTFKHRIYLFLIGILDDITLDWCLVEINIGIRDIGIRPAI